jgi:HK97 gp10 family phage protein
MKTFTLKEAAKHFALCGAAIAETVRLELDLIGKTITKEAKAEIGNYQPAMGDFESWPELADSTKRDRVRKGFTENDPLLRTGELRDSISYKVHGLNVSIGSTSDIMVYQELGTAKIPPRPVLGTALYKNKDIVIKHLGEAVFTATSLGKPISKAGYSGEI